MAYSAQSDVQTAVGGPDNLRSLADLDKDGVADAGVVDAAIAEADAFINTYASKRYAVPFASVPTTIKTLSARIAARCLRRNKPGATLVQDLEDEKNDRLWLTQLANGTVTPGVEPQPPKSEIVNDQVGPRDSAKLNSRERSKGFW
jgi:phage gp36-like protein